MTVGVKLQGQGQQILNCWLGVCGCKKTSQTRLKPVENHQANGQGLVRLHVLGAESFGLPSQRHAVADEAATAAVRCGIRSAGGRFLMMTEPQFDARALAGGGAPDGEEVLEGRGQLVPASTPAINTQKRLQLTRKSGGDVADDGTYGACNRSHCAKQL